MSLLFNLFQFVYGCVFVWVHVWVSVCSCAHLWAHMWKSGDNLRKFVLPFHHEHLEPQTQVTRKVAHVLSSISPNPSWYFQEWRRPCLSVFFVLTCNSHIFSKAALCPCCCFLRLSSQVSKQPHAVLPYRDSEHWSRTLLSSVFSMHSPGLSFNITLCLSDFLWSLMPCISVVQQFTS